MNQIRLATPEDAAPACETLRRSIFECCTEDHRNDQAILAAWLGNKTPETVEAWFRNPVNFCLVALTDGQVCGVAIMTRQGKIVLFYVAPEMRFTGTGKALLQALEAQARTWKLRTLQVASTLSAKAFYLRNGFILERTTMAAFGIEALSLTKQLDSKGYPRKTGCGCGG